TARTSACTRRSRAKPFGLPGPICRPSNEPSIPSAMSITTNGHTKPCRARRPPRCTVAHHASTRPTRHRSSIPATTSSSASPTRGRFASRKNSCLLPTLSSSTRSVSKRSTTGFGLSISAGSYWGALTNATTSSGPRDEVSPMLPVYAVTYLPGCTAPVVHSDRSAAERLRRDQLEPSRAGQPALVQGWAVAGDPGVDEELVLVDQLQPIELGRKLAATEEHAGRGRILQLLHARAQVAGDVVAVGPREVLSRRRHHVLRLGLQLHRPLAHRRRRLLVAAGDRRPVALHHLVGDAAPQHRPALVHEAGEEGVCLVVGGSLLVVDAAVQGDVDAEGQESHAGSLSHTNLPRKQKRPYAARWTK